MTNPDQALESAIIAVGANVAPRITPAEIAATIASEYYFTAADGVLGSLPPDALPSTEAELAHVVPQPLHLLTFCVLVLRNGFAVTGESACASPENFNYAIGMRIARENAVAKIWPLMGYALKQRLHNATGR